MSTSRMVCIVVALVAFVTTHVGCAPLTESNAGVDGGKEGGAIAVDLSEDGCLELVVNTLSGTRLLRGRCDAGVPILFEDITDTHASGMARVVAERSVVAADLNNDGLRDVVRSSPFRVDLFLNGGPLAAPPYRLGDVAGDPDRVFDGSDFEGGINAEGVAILDYDADGWLDLAVQSNGIELLRNPGDGTAAFTTATTTADRRGLPTG